jgi:hypothetical protein
MPALALAMPYKGPMTNSRTPYLLALTGLFFLGLAGPIRADAQGQGRGPGRRDLVVPKSVQPPPGMCRIWINGVPANKQPAPTDCWTALRDRPPNGRVLFGDVPRLRSGAGRRGGSKNDDDK